MGLRLTNLSLVKNFVELI